MDERAHSQFVDLIYDAAVDPHLWEPAMEQFADLIGGTSGWVSQLHLQDGTGSGLTARIDPIMPKRYWRHYSQSNPLAKVDDPWRYAREWDLRILTDEDWMAKDELVRGEYYNDFMRPQDVHSVMIVRLGLNDLTVSTLSVNRPERWGQFQRGEIERAQRLHPHLIRAFKINRRFAQAFSRDVGMGEALDRSPHGILLIDRQGRVRHTNAAADAMLRVKGGLYVREGRLRAGAHDAMERLGRLVAAAQGLDGASPVAGSMALMTAERRLPYSITVTPVRAERFSLFCNGPAVLVGITDLEAHTPVQDASLQQLFGLTPAERRLALALLGGLTLKEAAEEIGVSLNTVRDQLAAVFAKTGTGRQSQLLSLMLRTVGPFPSA